MHPQTQLAHIAQNERAQSGDPESYRVCGFVPHLSGVTRVRSTYRKLFQTLSYHLVITDVSYVTLMRIIVTLSLLSAASLWALDHLIPSVCTPMESLSPGGTEPTLKGGRT